MSQYLVKILLFLVLSFIIQLGYAQESNRDTISIENLDEIIITASKKKETLLQAPVSLEKLNLESINQSVQPSFFDAIQNLKGLQVLTPSMGFKVINARGFGNTTNVRFVQMVDGVDNQAPHIGAAIGNTLGPNDLDIYQVEIIPGSSSAMYGMNAINGVANFITKDPFSYQGFSFNQKLGVNNFNSQNSDPTLALETNLRMAKALNNKWAIKLNATYMKATDWSADNRLDLNPNANVSTNLLNDQNPGADRLNIYGDEQSNRRTLTLSGKQYVVSRTGYAEKELADLGLQNFKYDASLFFRPKEGAQISYTFRIAQQNNIYQRTNRFRFDNYHTDQHVIRIHTGSIQLNAYVTSENTGDTYNIRSIGENIDRSFKTDAIWFTDFSKAFNSNISKGYTIAQAMAEARIASDEGRPVPKSELFNDLISKLRDINNWDLGAALRVQAKLYNVEFQNELRNGFLKKLKEKSKLSLMYGVDFRNYEIIPDGNYFINPIETNNNLNYWKFGGFIQATRLFYQDKVKINYAVRMEKNEYYPVKFNPILAIVYTPLNTHSIRASIQSGYRFPSIFEAFSNINSGGRKRIGGLPIMSKGIFENSYTQASITSFQSSVQNSVNKNGSTLADAISQGKSLLQKNTYTYVQPEQVNSLEVGYRGEVLNKKLKFDIDFYYNKYKNLIAQIDVNVPKSLVPDSIPTMLQNTATQDRYRLWTNSKTISYNYGSSLGINYNFIENHFLTAIITYAKLAKKEQNDGLEDGFNTPEFSYNLGFNNPKFIKHFGYSFNFRHQNSFFWTSALASGTVPAITTIDAQISSTFMDEKLRIKLGGTNISNHYYYSYLGGPAIGAYYFTSITLSL